MRLTGRCITARLELKSSRSKVGYFRFRHLILKLLLKLAEFFGLASGQVRLLPGQVNI